MTELIIAKAIKEQPVLRTFADEVEEMPTKKKPTRGQRNFNKPLKRTKDSDNKVNRSKDKREQSKNQGNNKSNSSKWNKRW